MLATLLLAAPASAAPARTRGYRISGSALELLGRRGRTLAVLKRR